MFSVMDGFLLGGVLVLFLWLFRLGVLFVWLLSLVIVGCRCGLMDSCDLIRYYTCHIASACELLCDIVAVITNNIYPAKQLYIYVSYITLRSSMTCIETSWTVCSYLFLKQCRIQTNCFAILLRQPFSRTMR